MAKKKRQNRKILISSKEEVEKWLKELQKNKSTKIVCQPVEIDKDRWRAIVEEVNDLNG